MSTFAVPRRSVRSSSSRPRRRNFRRTSDTATQGGRCQLRLTNPTALGSKTMRRIVRLSSFKFIQLTRVLFLNASLDFSTSYLAALPNRVCPPSPRRELAPRPIAPTRFRGGAGDTTGLTRILSICRKMTVVLLLQPARSCAYVHHDLSGRNDVACNNENAGTKSARREVGCLGCRHFREVAPFTPGLRRSTPSRLAGRRFRTHIRAQLVVAKER
jgi:hypothetical protein